MSWRIADVQREARRGIVTADIPRPLEAWFTPNGGSQASQALLS